MNCLATIIRPLRGESVSFQSSQDHFLKCPAGPLCYGSQFLPGYDVADSQMDAWFSVLLFRFWSANHFENDNADRISFSCLPASTTLTVSIVRGP
jgi:hypothetical protein